MLACVGGVGCGDACGGWVPGRGLFARRWAAVASRGAEGRVLLREGVVAATGCLPRPEGLLCSGGGVNEWRVRECVGRRRALAVASGAVSKPGRGGSCCEGSAARGSRCGTWRGGGVGGGPGHLCDESVVSRRFVPGVACRCVGGGAVAGLGISSAVRSDSHLVCSSCCQLQASLLAEVTGCVWSDGAFRFSSRRFSSLFHRVRPRVPVGLSRCTAVVLAASLPVGDRGARSGRFFGAWSVDSDKLWCKGIG